MTCNWHLFVILLLLLTSHFHFVVVCSEHNTNTSQAPSFRHFIARAPVFPYRFWNGFACVLLRRKARKHFVVVGVKQKELIPNARVSSNQENPRGNCFFELGYASAHLLYYGSFCERKWVKLLKSFGFLGYCACRVYVQQRRIRNSSLAHTSPANTKSANPKVHSTSMPCKATANCTCRACNGTCTPWRKS